MELGAFSKQFHLHIKGLEGLKPTAGWRKRSAMIPGVICILHAGAGSTPRHSAADGSSRPCRVHGLLDFVGLCLLVRMPGLFR